MRRILLYISVSIVLIFGLLVFAIFAGMGDTKLHAFCFKVGYALSPSADNYLQSYANLYLENHNAGTLNSDIDEFLTTRLENETSLNEINAISKFYASRAGGREGVRIMRVSDDAKFKVVSALMNDLESFNSKENRKALLLIEEVRSGKDLGKGYFGLSKDYLYNPPLNWWETVGENETKTRFVNWWNLPLDWNTKKQINPLIDSFVAARSCCG